MISTTLTGKTILITGATGFLGQPLVEKILWAAPEVRRIYVLIRSKRQLGGRVLEAQERLERELYQSTVFERLQRIHGEKLEDFLRGKLVAVSGDISQGELGIQEPLRTQLLQELDIVINSAAVVSFDAPLDEALTLNVKSAGRLAEFTNSCEKAILVHVSTAYVCGATDVSVPETIYHSAAGSSEPFPPRRFRNVDEDIAKAESIIEEVYSEAHSPKRDREFKAALLKRFRRPRGGKKARRREKVENIRKKWIHTRLTEKGMAWARRRGWNDTYTYTKAMGEQLVVRARGTRPTVIVRPSVIESSLSEPNPGWLDGLRMADPLIVAIGKGRLRALPLNPDVNLDLVPVDMVVNALLAAIPDCFSKGGLLIFHVATAARNPITLGQLYNLIYEYFVRNPMLDREGNAIRIKRLRFPNPATFRFQHRLKSVPLITAHRTLERFSAFDSTQKVIRRLAATQAAHEKLFYYGEIYEPYLNLDCRFEVDNTMHLYHALSEDEQRRFNFDVTRLNWRHYIQNVHIPGVKKFILKIEGTGTLELEESIHLADHPFSTLGELLAFTTQKHPEKPALQIKRAGAWISYSYQDVRDRAEETSQRLLRAGLKKGDRVILFSENQPEWGIAYLAAASIGVILVPLDAQTWDREVWSIARFTEARAMFLSERCFKKLGADRLEENERQTEPIRLLNVDRFCEPFDRPDLPRSTGPAGGAAGAVEQPLIGPDDPASIIFTTGTAVDPRGAIHSHRNFLNNLLGVNRYLAVSPDDQFLSVLPLYHALEFSCGFLMALYGGATVTYLHSLKPKIILETMRETGTSCMLGVPTLYSLIRDDIERRILRTSKSTFKTNLMQTSKQLSRSVERAFGRNIGRRLFARVHEEFGGRIRVFVSGGSALGEALYRDFKALGFPIYEGYGLTETAPVLTVNPLHRSREGSAGMPIPGVELRLFHPDRDGVGEIIVRTPSLMAGYYRNPEATRQVIRDGWFHTGDLGWIDADGYVYITGRIKDVIVTGAGKNVYPAELEAIYRTVAAVQEICVVGIRSGLTEDIHAVIFPGEIAAGTEQQAEVIRKAVQQAVQKLARELPSYQRPQAVHVWDRPLPRNEKREICRRSVREQLLRQIRGEPEIPVAGRYPRRVREASLEAALYAELSRVSGESPEEINESTHLYTDLGLDSLMAIELLLFLEHQYGASISDENAAAFQTVGDVLQELRRTAQESAPAPEIRKRAAAGVAVPYPQRPFLDRAVLDLSLWIRQMVYRVLFRLKVGHADRIPRDGALIIAANHSSHLDFGAVVSALTRAQGVRRARRLRILGARDYFFNRPVKGWAFGSLLNLIPIEREEASLAGLRLVKSILSQGESLLIFPEGTRSRSGQMQKFKPGIGLIAWESKIPILPVYISGTYEALPPGSSLPRPRQLQVLFGPPIRVEAYDGQKEQTPRDELYRKIAGDVRQAVEQLAGESR